MFYSKLEADYKVNKVLQRNYFTQNSAQAIHCISRAKEHTSGLKKSKVLYN